MRITLDHIVLNVENVYETVNFYRDIFDFEIERLDDFEKGLVLFPSARINEETVIDFFPPKMWRKEGSESGGAKKNLNHFCLAFSEREWHRLTGKLKFHDVKITRFVDDNWGARGIGSSIYFTDPDGNEIEARYYPD